MSYPTIDPSILWTLGGGGPKKTPNYNTKKAKTAAGYVSTVAAKPYPTWDFNVDFENMLGNEASITDPYPLLLGLFMQTNGAAGAWYYPSPDPNDSTVTQQTSCMLDVTAASTTPMAQVGNGVSKQFQCARIIGRAGIDILQNVSVSDVYVNGVLKSEGTDYSVSATGVITFVVAPANNASLEWDGTFMYLCMFDDDTMDDLAFVVTNGAHTVHTLTGLKFSSIPVPGSNG